MEVLSTGVSLLSINNGGGGIPEAPLDNVAYMRKNGEWKSIHDMNHSDNETELARSEIITEDEINHRNNKATVSEIAIAGIKHAEMAEKENADGTEKVVLKDGSTVTVNQIASLGQGKIYRGVGEIKVDNYYNTISVDLSEQASKDDLAEVETDLRQEIESQISDVNESLNEEKILRNVAVTGESNVRQAADNALSQRISNIAQKTVLTDGTTIIGDGVTTPLQAVEIHYIEGDGVRKELVANVWDGIHKTYDSGELVFYNGYLFRAKHFIPISSYVSTEDWEQVSISDVSKSLDGAKQINIISNIEYMYAITDSNGVMLFTIDRNGNINWSKGIPDRIREVVDELSLNLAEVTDTVENKVDKEENKSLIDSGFANCVSVSSNDEYVFILSDADGRVLATIDKSGNFNFTKGLPTPIVSLFDELKSMIVAQEGILETKVDKEENKSLINEDVADHCDSSDNAEMFAVLQDTEGKVISGVKKSGESFFNLPVDFNGGINWSNDNLTSLSKALKDSGFTGGTGDWSDSESIEIPIPKMAVINFTNISQMPQTKTTDAHAIMEFWDMNGNYFKKKVIANAQGSSSMNWAKKNIGIDICNDDWEGDNTFKIKFGEWVPQDSFHIKAYATDYFRCVGLVGYDFVKTVLDTRKDNTTWKQALNYGNDPVAKKNVSPRIDGGALCYPQGFLCKVYLNNEFEGLFCWQLKKHRDNYNMNKKTLYNIHLDGMLAGNFFNGNIDWTAFEVRNPKSLITYAGEDYDGENPTELIDATSPAYDASNKNHVNTAKVKQYIINMSHRMAEIGSDKTLFEKYFGLESCIDYAIISDVLYNYDYVKNLQWTTWDGVKWFANPYDLDCTLGANSGGDAIKYPTTAHTTIATNHPLLFTINNYTTELEQRWKELRDSHIIDAKAISNNLEHYVRLFGTSGYEKEYEKWTDVPCNRDPVFDTDNWEMEVDENGNPVIYTTAYHTWNNTTNYTQGYVVQYSFTGSSVPGGLGWWYRFTAKQANINKPPITRGGFKDNIFRVNNWLTQQISNMDTIYNY